MCDLRGDPVAVAPALQAVTSELPGPSSVDETKLDPSSYCKCGKCSRMNTVIESFCCMSKKKQERKGNKQKKSKSILFSKIQF